AAEIFFITVCCALGAVLLSAPYLLEYRALVRLAESDSLTTAVEQIQGLEQIANQISGATAQWQAAQEQSAKTAGAAREIAERVTAEAAAFGEFLQKANDGEKANLRLEIEKLRRAEGDWLQIIVRMLDHVYALHQAAVRSGQTGLIEQLGNFQSACRDVARRIGLAPFVPRPGETFDSKTHQLADPKVAGREGAPIAEVIATGYTYQGRLLRPSLVTLQTGMTTESAESKGREELAAELKPAAEDLEETTLL
ncbi:MAG TPA: nucleotide exchange factor GrpE, partial [Verrucomicrobiae bacterium]|nr:nucleotide exchange factor GrpE [Verrucomicrobiae bacterium]